MLLSQGLSLAGGRPRAREGVARQNRVAWQRGAGEDKGGEDEERPPPLEAEGKGNEATTTLQVCLHRGPLLALAVVTHTHRLSPWSLRRHSWQCGWRPSCPAHRMAIPTAESISIVGFFLWRCVVPGVLGHGV